MTKVRCSILIPVYNGEKFILDTVNSCLSQTLIDEIEIIVIDDCSHDNSFEIVKELASLNKEVVTLKNECNLGINKTINKAASIAKGDYIMFLGHDDILRPNHVQLMLNEFSDKTVFVHCNADLINEYGIIFGEGASNKLLERRNRYPKFYLAFGNTILSTGAIIRKSFFNAVGGWDESFKNYGEWLLWTKLSQLGDIKFTTCTKAKYRRHHTNITNNFKDEHFKTELLEYFKLCKQNALLNIKNPLLKGLVLFIKLFRK